MGVLGRVYFVVYTLWIYPGTYPGIYPSLTNLDDLAPGYSPVSQIIHSAAPYIARVVYTVVR